MADGWDVVAGPGASSGYLNDADFGAAMDQTFGPGNWSQTGGWRSQSRENALRAQGAQTVPPGQNSPHNAGDIEAPGARDITVKGMSQDAAVAKLQSAGLPTGHVFAEGASGTQGPHVHVGMTPGDDPWAVTQQGADDPWGVVSDGSAATPSAKPTGNLGFQQAVIRLGMSTAGGAVKTIGDLIHDFGVWGDAAGQAAAKQGADTGYIVLGQSIIKLTPEQRAEAQQEVATNSKTVGPQVEPTAKAWQVAGEEIAPKNRNVAESIAHGAGEMMPAFGAAMVNPAAGAGVFALQGYGEAYDDAIAHGAPPEVARQAAAANAEIQGGLGLVPVGHAAGALVKGVENTAVRVGARYAAGAAGNATLMGAMRVGGNVVARQTYDPDRDWADQVPQAMAQGAVGDVLIRGGHDVGGAAWNVGKGLLRPREQPAASAPSPEAMPGTDAIRAYAGQGAPGAAPAEGDSVLFQTPEGLAKGVVIDTSGSHAVVQTPAGDVVTPNDQTVTLPKTFEGERVAHGASLEQMPQAIADVQEFRSAAPRDYSLFQAMRDLGGIRTEEADGSPIGEVQRALEGYRLPGLRNNKSGLSPDGMRELLQQRGWFGERAGAADDLAGTNPGDSINDLYALMDRERAAGGDRSQRVYHPTSQLPEVLARRADLEEQFGAAGIQPRDALETAAAKLAAWRGQEVLSHTVETEALRARAQELGVQPRADATHDELLADVLEREAIQGEADGWTADHYEDRIDHVLTPEEHEWLAEAGRRSEGEPDPPFPFEPPGGDEWRIAREEEDLGQHGPGAAGRGGNPQEVPRPDQLGELPRPATDEEMADYRDIDHADPDDPMREVMRRALGHGFAVDDAPDDARTAIRHGRPDVAAYILRRAEQAETRDGSRPPWMNAVIDKIRAAIAEVGYGRQAPSERVDLANGPADQLLIPGGERSAKQAAEARGEGPIRAKMRQKEADEGLFAPPPEAGLFDLKPTAPTPEAKQATAEAQPKGYGENNTIFTKERADEARRRLRDKLRNQLNAGLDPDLIRDGVELAGYHIEAGARLFGDYAKAMLEDLGEAARPYLKMWYESVRHYPGVKPEGMTPTEAITPQVVAGVRSDVSGGVEDLERRGGEPAAANAYGEGPLPAEPGQAQRGPGGPGGGNVGPGRGSQDLFGVPDRGAAPVGEPGAPGAREAEPRAAGQPAGRGEPGGSGPARDEGIQPNRLPAADLAAASTDSAHVEPVAADAHPFAESVGAPPVSSELERALPLLFPEQRGDVAFAEKRFDEKEGHGVLFTNGTGTGKTFTGGGLAKRFHDAGKRDILVIAPSQGILSHWAEAMEKLGVPFHVLEDTAGAGKGPVGTTYAALAANESLADRTWDLVIADEAHTLSSDQKGSETEALRSFRALTLHPNRLYRRAEMEMRAEKAKVDALQPPKGVYSGPMYQRWREAYERFNEKAKARVEELKALDRPKAAFLSATPFAYDKSIEWAHGYLFDWGPEPQSRGYNVGSAKDQFFMRHFGYRMRSNKLTKPEAAVESEIMERQFHEWLRRSGSLSGRVLNVDQDYDRKFALVHAGVGEKIDQALQFLRSAEDGKYRNLADAIDSRFNYLNRARLLEAIKAKAAIPIIRAHMALGRKVVVFHNFNEGGGFSPFAYHPEMEMRGGRPGEMKQLHEEFAAKNPYVEQIDRDLANLPSPIAQLTQAFPKALIYNGTVSKGMRERAKAQFNADGSPHNLIIVQSDAGQAGISLHDTSGKHQRALINLGLPVRPTAAIQQEGRIYRLGQKSDAILRYLNTGTAWERYAFASKIAERAGTAENLALGEQARTLRESFINAFLDSADLPPQPGEGKGGKQADFELAKAVTAYQKARSYYFAEAKKSGRRDQREGLDYFPTPEPLGLKMAEWADIRPGERVLEPSAGHGAIARFFPETADRTLIEPSAELASKAGLHAPGARVLQERFEDLHPVNKFDAIVMNPPFGHAGATAIDHLEKAMNHLRDGGRIVALIPRGATDGKFDKLMESDAAKGVYKVADIDLPTSTFERAGTKVRARVVVLERQNTPDLAKHLQETQRDYADASNINELFDRLEHASIKERLAPKVQEAEETARQQQPAPAAAQAAEPGKPLHGGFDLGQTLHGKTGELVYVATAKLRVSPEEYNALNGLAKKNGGYYSSFRGRGAIPGFQFKSEAQRDAFLRDAGDVSDAKFAKAPVFYSALERHIDASTLKAATPEQWKATIRNAPGLKKEELEWTGVNDWLDLFKGEKVPKEALQAFVRDNGVKVEERILGDKRMSEIPPDEEAIKDYGDEWERLVEENKAAKAELERLDYDGTTAEGKEAWERSRATGAAQDDLHRRMVDETIARSGYGGQTEFGDWTLPGGEDYRELLLTLPKEANPPATHWDTPGVMAHVRFDTRTAPDGKKVLFVQEIQSDWHQKGRDQGYRQPPDQKTIDLRQEQYDAAQAELRAAAMPFLERAVPLIESRRDVLANEAAAAREARDAALGVYRASGGSGGSADLYQEYHRLNVVAEERQKLSASLNNNTVQHVLDNWRTMSPDESLGILNLAFGSPAFRDGANAELRDQLRQEAAPIQPLRLHANEMQQALQRAKDPGGIPDAPFKSSWPALVMKRAIKWAVDHDFDRVAWTTGDQQAERYDLSHHVGRLTLEDNAAGGIGRADMTGPFRHGTLTVRDPSGNQVMRRELASEQELRELIGQPLADRLLASDPREGRGGHGWLQRERHLEGLDVKIGGEGMKAFYDRNLVNITNDLIRKYGAKVEEKRIANPSGEYMEYNARRGLVDLEAANRRRDAIDPNWRETRPHVAQAAKEEEVRHLASLKEAQEGLSQPGFDITPAMREAASGGLPLFKRTERGEAAAQPRGVRIEQGSDNDFTDRIAAAIHKIAPFAEVVPARRITETATGARAMGVSWRDGLRHLVAWSIESPDAVGIGRHEAVHALRSAGVIRPEEWEALERAASDEDWRSRYQIPERYGDFERGKQLEESIAERFREWRRDGERGLSGLVQTIFQRIAKVLDAIRDMAKRTFGQQASAADIFSRMESGEIGRRLGRESYPVNRVDDHDTPAFARPPADEERSPEARAVGDHINNILGRGVGATGRRLQRAAAKALPDPMVDALSETKDAVNLAVNPMAAGSGRAQAAAKDFANTLRNADFQHERLDKWLDRRFTDEQQRRMWEAADEEGVILRRGEESGPGQGLNRLDDAERAAVLELQRRADAAFEEAQALGMVKGDGLESYVPRMVVQMTAFGPKVLERTTPRQTRQGGNLSTTTGQLRQRKYELTSETEAAAQKAFGDKATVVRNIRTLPLATQRLERAIAGRTLVNRIKELSSQTGEPLVVEGQRPSDNYFTMDHPALQVWRPRFVKDAETGKITTAVDQNGDVVFEANPLWISKEFEGPLKAVLTMPPGAIDRAFIRPLMELKSKALGVIMYSPLMHNAVIWGRALAADPVGVATFEAYRRGFRAKMDPETMAEAINAGLVPITRHFDKIDTASIANNGATFTPGRSWTSQVLGYIPGLFDKAAGDAVKAKVDEFGDLWHNTFLWDRIGDLQMGLYTKIRDDLSRKANQFGITDQTAQRIAAHYANRYAGSLPMEGMSKVARQLANIVMFSRSFTLGNLAAYKDLTKGLPSDVRSQIERDAGAQQLQNAQGVARRKAIAMLALDFGFSIAGRLLAAGAVAWLTQQKFQAPWDNEEKYRNRFLLRYQSDGTAVYGRLPTGKTIEDLENWVTQPITTFKQKMSPYAKLADEIISNDKGFGRKVYDPYDHTLGGFGKNVLRVIGHTFESIAPTGQLQGAKDMMAGGPGVDRKTAALQTFLPVAGITVSKGAPGGPAIGDYYAAKDEHDFQVQQAMSGIQRQIKTGDVAGARAKMTELGIAPGLQNYYVRVAQNPGLRMSGRQLRDFERFANDEQRQQFARDRAATAARAGQ
jgi:hypothetical protein